MMDILEFRDINGPAPKGEIWTNKAKMVPSAPTLFRANILNVPPFVILYRSESCQSKDNLLKNMAIDSE